MLLKKINNNTNGDDNSDFNLYKLMEGNMEVQ